MLADSRRLDLSDAARGARRLTPADGRFRKPLPRTRSPSARACAGWDLPGPATQAGAWARVLPPQITGEGCRRRRARCASSTEGPGRTARDLIQSPSEMLVREADPGPGLDVDRSRRAAGARRHQPASPSSSPRRWNIPPATCARALPGRAHPQGRGLDAGGNYCMVYTARPARRLYAQRTASASTSASACPSRSRCTTGRVPGALRVHERPSQPAGGGRPRQV
jgi:hypothetical protein